VFTSTFDASPPLALFPMDRFFFFLPTPPPDTLGSSVLAVSLYGAFFDRFLLVSHFHLKACPPPLLQTSLPTSSTKIFFSSRAVRMGPPDPLPRGLLDGRRCFPRFPPHFFSKAPKDSSFSFLSKIIFPNLGDFFHPAPIGVFGFCSHITGGSVIDGFFLQLFFLGARCYFFSLWFLLNLVSLDDSFASYPRVLWFFVLPASRARCPALAWRSEG